jgi:hypothetical protein
MEKIFQNLKLKWNGRNSRRNGQYYGMVIDNAAEPLTNLRFADDVLLIAGSMSDVGKMIRDLKSEAKKFGLILHPGKTKILTNADGKRPNHIDCDGQLVEILKEGGAERYLGRKLTIDDYHKTEVSHRIQSGWEAFFKFKEKLCNHQLELKMRIKLFESVVTPCTLYACGAWTMTVDTENLLRTTRRKMLRWMVQITRTPDEDWVQYITRATHRSEDLAATYGATDWVQLQRQRKWKLAGLTARRTDGRWSKKLLEWRPWFRTQALRNVGRPRKRWSDDFVKLAGGSWTDAASNVTLWNVLETGFIDTRW